MLLIFEAHPEQVVRFCKTIVERHRAAERFEGQLRLPVAVEGERQLVEDVRRAVVERQVAAVDLRRARVASPRDVDIAQQLQGPWCSRIEEPGLAEGAQRSAQLAT